MSELAPSPTAISPATAQIDGFEGAKATFGVLPLLDARDSWAVDFAMAGSRPAPALTLFLKELAAGVPAAAPVLHKVPREMAQLLARLTSTRCMALVAYIAQHNKQFLDSLAFLIETDGDVDPALAAIRRRFEAITKARLLGEIFSGERLHRIHSIMESYTDE